MLTPLVAWITDALDRGLDIGFRVVHIDPSAGGDGGVFRCDWRVTDLAGEPLPESLRLEAERAHVAPTGENG